MEMALLVGSLRTGSFSRKIARALVARAPEDVRCHFIEISDLPLYDEDRDLDPPESWTRFRNQLASADGVLFVTPEYNRSLPGGLKNALDVGSRPEGKSVFDGKPAGVVSVTPYGLGAFGANQALRQTFVFLNMPVMQQPEAYISGANGLFDAHDQLKDEKTGEFLARFMGAFVSWVSTVGSSASAQKRFADFLKLREPAARDYVNGDPSSIDAMATRIDPATFFSPRGDTQQGAEAVASRYRADAEHFQKGGTTRLEVLHSYASGDLAYWTGIQHAAVKMGKEPELKPMALRITELFRLENGAYKLIHRHADPLPAPSA